MRDQLVVNGLVYRPRHQERAIQNSSLTKSRQLSLVTTLYLVIVVNLVPLIGCTGDATTADPEVVPAQTYTPPANGITLLPAILVDDSESQASQMMVHRFRIPNPTLAPVQILRTRTGCGCTKASLSSNLILPGGFVDLDVKFDLRGRVGNQRISCVLETDKIGVKTYEAALDILRVADFVPKALAPGRLPQGEEIHQCVEFCVHRLTDPMVADSLARSIRFETSCTDKLKLNVTPHKIENDGQFTTLRIPLTVTFRAQPHRNTAICDIKAHFVLDEVHRMIRLPVRWQVSADVAPTPRALLFRLSPAGARDGKLIKTVKLDSASGQQFGISRVSCDELAITASYDADIRSANHTIIVSLDVELETKLTRYSELIVETTGDEFRIPVALINRREAK